MKNKITKVELVEKYNNLADQYKKLNDDYIKLVNVIINIDFQCFCAKLKTPTIKRIRQMIDEYHSKEK